MNTAPDYSRIPEAEKTKLTFVPKVMAEWTAPFGGLGGQRVLDFGCGDGVTALGVAINHPPALLVGADLGREYERAIVVAKQIQLNALPGNLRFETVSPGQIASEDEFDVIYSWSVFEHIGQHLFDDVVARLRAKLRPGGHLFVQISPLYYSPEGSHLWAIGFTAWEHLTWQLDRVQAELRCRFDGKHADALWSMFATLNKLTAPRLVDKVASQGFEVVRRLETTVKMEPPKELLSAYTREALLTDQVLALFRKI